MNRSPRPGLVLLLLLVIALAAAPLARADTITYQVIMHWQDLQNGPPNPPDTTGFFTLTTDPIAKTFSLDNWSLDTPTAGLFQKGLADQYGYILVPFPECTSTPGCFDLQFRKPWPPQPLFPSVLTLYFPGSIFDFHGGLSGPVTLTNGNILLSRLICGDPACYYSETNEAFVPPVPEPSSIVLIGSGLLSGAWVVRRRMMQPARRK